MKILLDHCIDWRLERLLAGHEVKSAQELGWDQLTNGKLLAAAAAGAFRAVITVDQHLKDQQNIANLPVAVIVLLAASSRTSDLEPLIPFIELALPRLVAGQLIEIDAAGNVKSFPARSA